jgi:hypothetical protein
MIAMDALQKVNLESTEYLSLKNTLSSEATIHLPGSTLYEKERKLVYNTCLEAHPTIIITCASTKDVQVAVKYARVTRGRASVAGGNLFFRFSPVANI